MDTCVCVCFGSVDGRVEGLTGCLQCSRQTGETLPDELTGPHVEHQAGLRFGVWEKCRKGEGKTGESENMDHAGLENGRWGGIKGSKTTCSVPLVCSMSVWVCASPQPRLRRSPFHLI